MEKQNIKQSNISKPILVRNEMSSSYLSYAMSVIVSRALPDVRDGLKPVHRRIIFAMYKGGYDWSKNFRKSARIVGDVIGKYHPHGDQAVYDALVRLVQDFSMSLPLLQGQGNFGSIDGDPPAAMRYTETKLGKISQFLTEDLEKNTVTFRNNYDETEKEPTVLPSQYPNLLVNGAGGIAVGMATSIPPHNLGEVIDATNAYIENQNITISQLMKYVPGPDFPTGGLIIGKEFIKQGYNKGRGSFKIRGEIEFEEKKNGRAILIIKSIPYQVNKSFLNEKIALLARDKKIEGISDIRDESNREGIRIVIELRRGVEPETIRRQLYKLTNVESSFGFNSLALVENKPKLLNLKEFISEFLKFRESTVVKRVKFDLKKAEERAHILIGLATAVEKMISEIGEEVTVNKKIIMSGENLVDAQPRVDNQTNRPMVSFTLDRYGAQKFGKVTTNNIGKKLAIVLDDKIISAPVIRESITGGSGTISGNFSFQEVTDLALLLRSGALPTPINIVEERTVGPDLGKDSIISGTISLIIGFVLVVLYMFYKYRFFGLIANISLISNLLMLVGVLTILEATLTLPGIAGIILTVGMAVDANVLIFERIREELRTEKSIIHAFDMGYNRAKITVLDANLTTLLATIILFFFGSGPVKGFAVTLGIGIITTLFSAYFIARHLTSSYVLKNKDNVSL